MKQPINLVARAMEMKLELQENVDKYYNMESTEYERGKAGTSKFLLDDYHDFFERMTELYESGPK